MLGIIVFNCFGLEQIISDSLETENVKITNATETDSLPGDSLLYLKNGNITIFQKDSLIKEILTHGVSATYFVVAADATSFEAGPAYRSGNNVIFQGNVGIGVSPTKELEVTGSGNVYTNILSPEGYNSYIELFETNGLSWQIYNHGSTDDKLKIGNTLNGVYMTFDSANTNILFSGYIKSTPSDETYRILYNNPSGYFDTSGIIYSPYTEQTTLPGNLYRDSTGHFVIGIATEDGYDDKIIVINPAGAQDVTRAPYITIAGNDNVSEPNRFRYHSTALSTFYLDSADLDVFGDAYFHLHPGPGGGINMAADAAYKNMITANTDLLSELHIIAGQGDGIEVKPHRFDINDSLFLVSNSLIEDNRLIFVNSSDQVVSSPWQDTTTGATNSYLKSDSTECGIYKSDDEMDGTIAFGWLQGSDYGPKLYLFGRTKPSDPDSGRVRIEKQTYDSIGLHTQGLKVTGNQWASGNITADSVYADHFGTHGAVPCSLFDGVTYRDSEDAYWQWDGNTFTINLPELSGVVTASTSTYLTVPQGAFPNTPQVSPAWSPNWTVWINDASSDDVVVNLQYVGIKDLKICANPSGDFLDAGTITFYQTTISYVTD